MMASSIDMTSEHNDRIAQLLSDDRSDDLTDILVEALSEALRILEDEDRRDTVH